MVHIPAKFRENTAMHFQVTLRKLNMTDRQTDGRGAQYLPSRAFGAAGDKRIIWLLCDLSNRTLFTCQLHPGPESPRC